MLLLILEMTVEGSQDHVGVDKNDKFVARLRLQVLLVARVDVKLWTGSE